MRATQYNMTMECTQMRSICMYNCIYIYIYNYIYIYIYIRFIKNICVCICAVDVDETVPADVHKGKGGSVPTTQTDTMNLSSCESKTSISS